MWYNTYLETPPIVLVSEQTQAPSLEETTVAPPTERPNNNATPGSEYWLP